MTLISKASLLTNSNGCIVANNNAITVQKAAGAGMHACIFMDPSRAWMAAAGVPALFHALAVCYISISSCSLSEEDERTETMLCDNDTGCRTRRLPQLKLINNWLIIVFWF